MPLGVPAGASSSSDIPFSVLTRSARKGEIYRSDPYVREAWDAWAAGDRSVEDLRRIALIVLRPDGLVSPRLEELLADLAERDLKPVAVRWVTVTPHMLRALWWYQLSRATGARLAVLDAVFGMSQSLIVAARDRLDDDLPLAVRVAALKGSNNPHDRSDASMRSRLRCPNRILSGVHAPDEPIDVLRDLAIFRSLSWASELVEDAHTITWEALASDLSNRSRVDLARLADAVRTSGGREALPPAIHAAAEACKSGRFLDVSRFVKRIGNEWSWEAIAVASELVLYERDRDTHQLLLSVATGESWASHEGKRG